MISNAVANTTTNTGTVRSGHAGRASGETDSTFRDVLDKSSGAEAETPRRPPAAADSESGSAFSDTSWRSALGKVRDEGQLEDGTGTAVSDIALPEGEQAPIPDAEGEPAAQVRSGQPDLGGEAVSVEAGAAADALLPNAAPAVGANAAGDPARPGDLADTAPGVTGPVDLKTGAAASSQAAGRTEGLARNLAGSSAELQSVATESLRPTERGLRDNSTGAAAPGRTAAVASPEANALNARSAIPALSADAAQGQERGTIATARVTDGLSGEARPASGGLAGAAGRPSTETAGTAARLPGPAEALPATGETSAGRQIADAVARELEELTPSRLSLTGSTLPGGRVVKTMRLQLNPAELGTVNIRMQSVDGELRVTIQAESDKTARMLGNDADAIRSALRAAGVGGADVVVTGNRNEQAQSQNFGAQHREPSGQQAGAQENRQNASSESRQSYRDSSSNDSVQSQARGGDVGDNGTARGGRIVI